MNMKYFTGVIVFALSFIAVSTTEAQQNPNPEGAFVRSLVLPGWGHYYVDPDSWVRGQVHLGAEAALIVSYFGFSVRAENLENQYKTLASLKAGVDITDRNRSFEIALGDFDTLAEYNDFQLRSRNWNRLYADQSENRWNWESGEARNDYNNLRSDVDRVRNQLPAILGLMVVNRVISAVNAYNRAKNQSEMPTVTLFPVSTSSDKVGVVAQMYIRF